MLSEIRTKFLAVLRDLEQKQSVVAAQDDLKQVIRVLQYLLMEESVYMSLHDNVPHAKGEELGILFASAFQVQDNEQAHMGLGKFFARLAGYNDMDNGWEFIAGFMEGMKNTGPKLIEGKK